jgi:preprotein translocase subunit SecD
VLVQVPGEDRESVRELLAERGVVRIDIYYPTENNSYSTEQAVLTSSDFQRIGSPTETAQAGPHVPVTVTEEAATSFQESVVETGLSGGGSGSRCSYETNPESSGACLLTVVDGEVVFSSGMAPSLGQSMESGQWAQERNFIIQTESLDEANELSLNLRAGGLPARLNFDGGTVSFISGSQGDRFLQYGLLIGIMALLGVSAKVAYKYQDARVAIPMILSSMSEVYILLGVAAFLGYPIDLAVIGGFVAVIGTGVDDLIIIANEVLAKQEIKSNYAFEKRYSVAFWVIGAAAATTIIALLPLVALSLGSLSGFAIFTIIGVLVGVFVTRPAYGKTLQSLIVQENN